jgi:hypothetical protein
LLARCSANVSDFAATTTKKASAKSNNAIKMLEKYHEIEERISNIGLLFVALQTNDIEQFGIPNSVVLV